MSFLNDLDKKLNQLGQGAVKKTKGATDAMRISGLIREEENKQNALYKQIGVFFYEAYAEVAEGPLKDFCVQISASKKAIDNLQKQLSFVKGVKFCPSCHAEFPGETMFCNRCGTKLPDMFQPQMHQPAASSENRCSKCGSAIAPGQLFCTNCGNKVTGNVVENDVTETIKQEYQEFSYDASENVEPVIEEPTCSEPEYIEPVTEDAICEEQTFEEEPVMESVEIIPEQNTCPNCGVVVETEQVFCINCGTRL